MLGRGKSIGEDLRGVVEGGGPRCGRDRCGRLRQEIYYSGYDFLNGINLGCHTVTASREAGRHDPRGGRVEPNGQKYILIIFTVEKIREY